MRVQSHVVLSAGPAQVGLDLVGAAGAVVLVLMLVAIAAFAYKSLTGGVEWPTDEPEDEDDLRRGGQDDEWDYY